ncbi:MAG: hypothetical protein L0H15_07945 [Nitrosospira sp.]|nr:hypothetical protein [Nitrosospira sp.]
MTEIRSLTNLQHNVKVSRLTAAKYLESLAAGGFLHKRKIGRSSYYINSSLYRILTGEVPQEDEA